MKTATINRHELYERVWQEPMMRLAKSFGLSDVGLAKVCKKQGIPRPPRGYWAKKQAGQSPRKVALPNPDHNPMIALSEPHDVANSLGGLSADVRKECEVALKDEPRIEVRDTLRGAHGLVSQTNELLAGAQSDSNGLLVLPKTALPLALRLSKHSLRRALLIMDALLRACEHRGYAIIAGPKVEILGVQLSLGIEEQLETVREQPKELDLDGRYAFGHSRFDKRWRPSGRLILRLYEADAYWARGSRHTWRDGEKSTLENRLDQVIPALVQLAVKFKQHAVEVQRREQERKEQELRRQQEAQQKAERRQAYRAEQARVRALLKQAKHWRIGRELRLFIEAASHAHISKHGCIDPGSQFADWLEWARLQADRIDPLSESKPSILDEDPAQFDDPRPNYIGSWNDRR